MSANADKENMKEVVEEEIVIQTGLICGKSLKGMAMGEYFIDYEIDEEEFYEIDLYEPKDVEDRGWMAIMRFRIPDLSEKYHEVHYNTSSAFACEQENIRWDEDDKENMNIDMEENEEEEWETIIMKTTKKNRRTRMMEKLPSFGETSRWWVRTGKCI